MSLLRYFNWFTRDKIALLIGLLALVMGAIYPWYCLPTQALEVFRINLFLANLGKFIAIFLSLAVILNLIVGIKRSSRFFCWCGLIAVLLFPYFITTWQPSITFLATSYYEQDKRVTSHVEKNFPEVQAQWKQNISLDKSRPITSIFDFSIQDSRFFQMPSWEQILLAGLGYKNSFFLFIGRGWGFTVTGLIISLMGLYLSLTENKIDALVKDIRQLLPGMSSLLVTIILSLICVNILNYHLDTLFAKGEYRQVTAVSQTLASWYPPLRGDEEFIERMAKAGFYANQPDLASINFVKGLERYRARDFVQAKDYFQKSLDIQPNQFLVRGYLATTLLNQGIEYYNNSNTLNTLNSRRAGGATDLFTQALQVFPGHIEISYDLMLARVVDGQFEKSAETAQEIIEVYKNSNSSSVALLGQAYLHLAWADYRNDEIKTAWARYRQSIDSSTWKESTEEQE
jgi:tetratricopeptide (TPR) repeat protein